MKQRPLLVGIALVIGLCLALAAIDVVTVLTKPLHPWFAWLLP